MFIAMDWTRYCKIWKILNDFWLNYREYFKTSPESSTPNSWVMFGRELTLNCPWDTLPLPRCHHCMMSSPSSGSSCSFLSEHLPLIPTGKRWCQRSTLIPALQHFACCLAIKYAGMMGGHHYWIIQNTYGGLLFIHNFTGLYQCYALWFHIFPTPGTLFQEQMEKGIYMGMRQCEGFSGKISKVWLEISRLAKCPSTSLCYIIQAIIWWTCLWEWEKDRWMNTKLVWGNHRAQQLNPLRWGKEDSSSPVNCSWTHWHHRVENILLRF